MKLVVLGMHRSGNSVLAGVLKLMGAHPGSVASSGHTAGNLSRTPHGQTDVSSLNETLLHAVNCEWDHLDSFSIDRLSPADVNSFNVQANKLLAQCNVHQHWVISDPGLCLLFPLWQPLVPDCICIHLFRNPIEVARSLQAHKGTPASVGIALWEKYTRAALYASRAQPNLFVSHKRLVAQPEVVAQELLAALSARGMEGLSAPAAQEIRALIDTGLFKQRVGDESCPDFLNAQQAELFQSLADGSIAPETIAQEISGGAGLVLQDFELGRYRSTRDPDDTAVDQLQGQQLKNDTSYRQQLDALRERASAWQRQADSLQAIVERLVSGVNAMTRSNTWKLVARLVTARQKLLGRQIAPSSIHVVRDAIADYGSWKEGMTAVRERMVSDSDCENNSAYPQRVLRSYPTIDVLVCVHDALEEVKCCLDSVVENTRLEFTLYVVNDGSGRETTDFLRDFRTRHPKTVLLENAQAGGYTRAANRGLRECTAEYVVCLNSDTVVPRLWLDSLVECAQSDPAIGIVGPLSNAASWQSVPERFDDKGDWAVNELPAGFDVNQMAELVYQVSRKSFPRVDFVNGFCFVVKRAVIDAIGYLDEQVFPRGYGEENDYCLRAAAAGFRLAIADQAYVYHAKSRSYSHEKRRALSKKGGAALKKKHGAKCIDRGVAALENSRHLQLARAQVRLYLKDGSLEPRRTPGLPRLLYVVDSAIGDGAHTVIEEVAAVRGLGLVVRVAWLASGADDLQTFDPANALSQEQSLLITDEEDLGEASRGVDLLVATSSRSLQLVKPWAEKNQHMLVAYRIDDYEPRSWEEGSEDWRGARDSYTGARNMCLFATTERLAEVLREEHGVRAWSLYAGFDIRGDRPSSSAAVTRAAVLSMLSRCRMVLSERHIALHRARAPLEISAQRPLRVAVWPCVRRMSAEPTGSAYIRLIEPLGSRSSGGKLEVSIVHSVENLKEQAADICIVQRNAIPHASMADELFAYCQGQQMPVVHEIDDDLFNRHDNAQAALDDLELRTLRGVAARSDAVTTSTPSLQRRLRSLNANVFCVQNALSEELWCRERIKPEPGEGRPVRFLYMGTRTHGKDLGMIEEAWRRIEEQYGGRVSLDVVGGVAAHELAFGNPVAIPSALGYPEFVRWLKTQGPWDIGLIPLTDTRFNQNKSHIKFLDYSALSLAIVCSDVSAYGDIARHEENALLVGDGPDEWVEAMARLIENEALRCKLGEEAFNGLIKNYCLESRAGDWLETLNKVVNG